MDEPRPTDDDLPARLGDPDWRIRRSAVRRLVERPLTAEQLDGLLSIVGESHHDLSRLNGAIQILAQTGADVLPALIELLGSADADVRCYAALALGERGDVRAAESLLRLLDDSDANVVMHAIEALGRLRAAAAVDRLAGFVRSRHFAFGFSALTALASIGDERVAADLLPLFDDPLLRPAAVEALGALGDIDSIGPLVDCLRSGAEPAAAVARALLGIFDREQARFGTGPEVVRRIRAELGATAPSTWSAVVDQASAEDMPAVIRLLEVVGPPESIAPLARLVKSPTAGDPALPALARQGSAALPAVIEALPMADSEARREVAAALGDMRDPAAFAPLVNLLDDEESELVIAAVEALGRLGDPRTPDRLDRLFDHPDKGVRHAAVGATLLTAAPESVAALVPMLDDPAPLRREAAVKILGTRDARSFAPQLTARYDDPDERVRRAVVEHLQIPDDETRHRVAVSARSDRPAVRAAAAAALASAAPELGRPLLVDSLDDADPWVRYVGLRELLKSDPSRVSLERLGRFIDQTDDAPTRILALIEWGKRRAPPAKLLALIDDGDSDVEAAALRAFGVGRYEEGASLLDRRLNDPDPRRRPAAVEAWSYFGGDEAARSLAHAALDHDPAVSRAAISALAGQESAESTAILLELAAIPWLRDRVVPLLASSDPAIVGYVARGLHHERLEVRRAAVEVLTRQATPEAVERIAAVTLDSQPSLRHAARHALARLRPPPRGETDAAISQGGR
jgi:HEAT repeat protein